MRDSLKVSGWALNSEYFSSVMHMLRTTPSYRAIVDELVECSEDAYVRHTEAVKRICTAFLKLLFPNVRTAAEVNKKEFIKYCLRPASKCAGPSGGSFPFWMLNIKMRTRLMPEFELRGVEE